MKPFAAVITAWLLAAEHITFPPPFDNATLAPEKELVKVHYPNKDYYWLGDNSTTDWTRIPRISHNYTVWLTNNDTKALSKSLDLFSIIQITTDHLNYDQVGVTLSLNGSDTYRIVLSEWTYGRGNDTDNTKPKQILGYSDLFAVRKDPGLEARPPPPPNDTETRPPPTDSATSLTVNGLGILALALSVVL